MRRLHQTRQPVGGRLARRGLRPTRFTSCRRRSTSTGWAFPGSPRDLNSPNRRMRTRMSGGVGGVERQLSRLGGLQERRRAAHACHLDVFRHRYPHVLQGAWPSPPCREIALQQVGRHRMTVTALRGHTETSLRANADGVPAHQAGHTMPPARPAHLLQLEVNPRTAIHLSLQPVNRPDGNQQLPVLSRTCALRPPPPDVTSNITQAGGVLHQDREIRSIRASPNQELN